MKEVTFMWDFALALMCLAFFIFVKDYVISSTNFLINFMKEKVKNKFLYRGLLLFIVLVIPALITYFILALWSIKEKTNMQIHTLINLFIFGSIFFIFSEVYYIFVKSLIKDFKKEG